MAMLGLGLAAGACGLAFVAAPHRGRGDPKRPGLDEQRLQADPALPSEGVDSSGDKARARAVLLLSAAAGLGAGMGSRSAGARGRSQRAASKVDWLGTSTRWGDIEEKSIYDVDWRNIHGVMSLCAILLFIYQAVRIMSHQAPSIPEVWITTAVYLPWTALCWFDTEKLEKHYRVTFYASCGWAVMSLASLHSVVYQDKFPQLAFGVLALGNAVFAVSCAYFYSYHWSRMWRHLMQNRFRPLWIPGLVGLMSLHALTVADFAKRIDDMGWWKTVCLIYPDEWWWVADVRIIELFFTAAALWLIILHIQGVFTGMKNAAIVVIGTVFAPLLLMGAESTWLRASAWQHYLMVGPKYF